MLVDYFRGQIRRSGNFLKIYKFLVAATIEKIKEDIEEDYEQLRNQLEML